VDEGKSLRQKLAFTTELAENTKPAKNPCDLSVISLAKNLCNLWLHFRAYKPAPAKAGGASTSVESPLQIRPFYAKQTQFANAQNESKPLFDKGLQK
jgi:hypothetical protein